MQRKGGCDYRREVGLEELGKRELVLRVLIQHGVEDMGGIAQINVSYIAFFWTHVMVLCERRYYSSYKTSSYDMSRWQKVDYLANNCPVPR